MVRPWQSSINPLLFTWKNLLICCNIAILIKTVGLSSYHYDCNVPKCITYWSVLLQRQNQCFCIRCMLNETKVRARIHWLDRRIVRKQQDIMSTYHYVQNQGKLIMQSREKSQKPQFGQFFDDLEVKYLQIANFSEK